MKKQPIFVYTEGTFYKVWLGICILIAVAAIASSFLVYFQVARQLKTHVEQRLLWEAKFYRQQLDEVFIRTAQRLDSLVHSSAAISTNRPLLQDEMATIQTLSPSVIRSWVAYPDGTLITAPNTRPDVIKHLPWWREYLSGNTPKTFAGLWVGRGQSLVGEPFIDASNVTALIPLFSLKLQGIKVIRAAGAQLDLNSALTDNLGIDIDWSEIPVSIYSNQGILIACPYRYYRGNLKLSTQSSLHPLIRQMLVQPKEISGFKIYQHENRKLAGVYLQDPLLGLVLTVEYPAAEVVDPVSRIALGPLVVTVLLILITSILASTIYTNTKRLHQVEQLARSAELRALQAHINPHFLFNTLDRMVGMAVTSENTPLLKMLRSLSNIFRYTTRRMGDLVTLNEELNYLQEYIALQQIRYGYRFTFQLMVPDGFLSFRILKFSIQPLVENCFVHGVEKSFDPISIKIRITRTNHSLLITVSDDGPGITPERLAEVQKSLEEETYTSDNQGHGVGLSNIHHRYKYAYGNSYGIRLEASEHETTVYLEIPLL